MPNCVPQSQYMPDSIVEDWLEYHYCPICDNEDIHIEKETDDEGFTITKYWCDTCEKYVSPKIKE